MKRLQGVSKLKQYNFTMLVNNGISYIYTRFFWKKSRLVRFPIRVYGKRFIQYGKGLTIGNNSKIDIATDGETNEAKLVIGNDCIFGDMLHIAANYHVVIGDNLLTASRVFITDSNHGNYSGESQSLPEEPPNIRQLNCKETVIGNNVWIGENVSILAGSRIGDSCIIASNAVVSGVFPDRCILGGIPAKIIKIYNDESKRWERV